MTQERKIIEQVVAGDHDAFELLVKKYEDKVYHLCLRMCADPEQAKDLAQEAFIKAWRGLRFYKHEAAFSTWLYRITVNCARDHCRSENRRPAVSLTPAEDGNGEPIEIDVPVTEGDEVPESALDRKETVRAVRRAIESLPEDMRQVIILRDLQELPYAEIASLMGIEVGTVKSRISRGRAALRELLQGML